MSYDEWLTKEINVEDQDCIDCIKFDACDYSDCDGFERKEFLTREDYDEEN